MATLDDPELGRRPPRARSRGAATPHGVTLRLAAIIRLAALTRLGRLIRAPRRPSGRPALLASALVGVLLSLLVVQQQTEAAFTASTLTAASWGTASVTLTDDDSGSALINATLAPAQWGTKCIQVTYTGTISAPIRLYATSAADADALGAKVSLTVEEGSGGTFSGGCAGFQPSATSFDGTFGSFITSATGFSTGVGSWTADPATSTTQVYRVTWWLDPSTGAAYQGKSVGATFVWESRA